MWRTPSWILVGQTFKEKYCTPRSTHIVPYLIIHIPYAIVNASAGKVHHEFKASNTLYQRSAIAANTLLP
jgi:hypothetical protein